MAIVANVEQRCNCGLYQDHITNSAFQCFPDSPQAVTYRAVLHGTSSASSSKILRHIEQWITEGTTVSILNVIYNVDQNCVLLIYSNRDNECKMADESIQPAVSSGNLTGGVRAGTVATVLTVTPAMTIILTAVYFTKKRKKNFRQNKLLKVNTIIIHFLIQQNYYKFTFTINILYKL